MKFALLMGAASTAALFASAAAAQEQTAQAPAAASTGADEMIIVTGSRIARPTLDSTVPVTSLGVEELTQTGEVSIGDQLSLLPAFRPNLTSQNSGRFIGTAGLSILDLRGQGAARTLVLQSGRRHVTSQPGQQTVDVNTIPVDLIDRVDVVTGGNSAIYGSDAVAGVVNFVMKRDFDGLRARGQIGISSRGDRPTYYGSVTAGRNFNDGRGNIAVSFEYSQQDPLFFTDRDAEFGGLSGRSMFQLVEDTSVSGPGGTPEPAAGNGIPDTNFIRGIKNIGISTGGAYTSACPAPASPANAARRGVNCKGLFTGAGAELGRVFVFVPGGNLVENRPERDFRPFGSGNGLGGLGSTLRESGLLQAGVKRYAGNLLFNYEVSEGFRPFAEAKFVRTEALQEGQPTFNVGGGLSATYRLDNPFISDQARALLAQSLAPGATTFVMQRFNVDFGGRGENHTRDLFRAVAGFDGTFNETWRYEVAFSYGRTDTFYQTRGNIFSARTNNASDAARDPMTGRIVCRINIDANPANDDPNCVPLNVFGFGAPSQAALNYISHTSSRKQFAEQVNAIAFISGDFGRLFRLPGGPVAFSVGSEWRQDRANSAFDPVTASGVTFLNAIALFTPRALRVLDGFAEIRVPLLADLPFFEELTIEGATRVSNYNVGNAGTVWAFNVGGIWSPVQDIRLRAAWARSVRAPTQTDLFGSTSQTFLNGLADPCGQQNINANPNRRANCAAAGVPTTQTFVGITEPFTNRPSSGISGLSGGNPNLEEERGTSITVGGLVRPRFLPGLLLTVDYYDIRLRNAINTIGSQTIINQCYDSPDGIDNQFCRAINRNPNGTFAGQANILHAGQTVSFPTTGSSFLQGPFNYARQRTEGIDFDLFYQYPTRGDWNLSMRGTVALLLKRNLFTSLVEPNRRTQELLALGNPEWAGQLNVTLGYQRLTGIYNMRYVGKMTTSPNFRDQFSEQGRPPENADSRPFAFYPETVYHDVRAEMRLAGESRLFFGIDNLLDTMPPFDQIGSDSAGAGIYTTTGRFFYTGVDIRF